MVSKPIKITDHGPVKLDDRLYESGHFGRLSRTLHEADQWDHENRQDKLKYTLVGPWDPKIYWFEKCVKFIFSHYGSFQGSFKAPLRKSSKDIKHRITSFLLCVVFWPSIVLNSYHCTISHELLTAGEFKDNILKYSTKEFVFLSNYSSSETLANI